MYERVDANENAKTVSSDENEKYYLSIFHYEFIHLFSLKRRVNESDVDWTISQEPSENRSKFIWVNIVIRATRVML